jgi:hypothetical protein
MAAIVWLAWRVSGGRKMGTPLLIDSMPVSAVQPEEKVCSSRNNVSGTWGDGTTALSWPGPSTAARATPTAIMTR